MLSLSSVVLRSGTYHFAVGDNSARRYRKPLTDNGKSFCFRTLFADNGIFAYNCVAVNNGILDNAPLFTVTLFISTESRTNAPASTVTPFESTLLTTVP